MEPNPTNLEWFFADLESNDEDDREERNMLRKGMDPNFDWGSNHHRAGQAIQSTVNAALRGESADKVLFFTLTFRKFPAGQSPFRYAHTCFKKAWRGPFSRRCEHYVYVLDVDEKGRPHIHGITFARQPVRAGFDPDAYDRYIKATKQRLSIKAMRKLRAEVSNNSHLRLIWKDLDKNLPRYGFGPLHGVFPIREEVPEKGGSKTAYYLLQAYHKAVPAIRKGRVKGIRAYQISKNFPSKKRASDMTSPLSIAARVRLRELLNLDGDQCFAALLGRKWGLYVRDLIDALDRAFGLDPFRKGWRESHLGTGDWLASRMLFLIESDYVLYKRLSVFIPALKRKAEGYVRHVTEPAEGFFVPACRWNPDFIGLPILDGTS